MNKAIAPLSGLLLLLIFSACGSQKIATGNAEVENFRQLKKVLNDRQEDYGWMSARIKINMETPDQRNSAVAYLKMRNDSVIWMSVSVGFGLEVIRAQITPDSIYVLDRFNRKYVVYHFSWINQYFRARELDFNNLENLFFGNPLFEVDNNYKLRTDSASIVLTYENPSLSEFLSLVPGLLKVGRFRMERNASRQKLTIDYSGYVEVEDYVVPSAIDILALNPEQVTLQMKLSRVSFNPRENVNFGVPSNYERVQ